MKIIISLLLTVFPYSIFANSFDLKLDCVGIRGVSIDKSGYIGEKIKKHTSKARLDIKYVTIKNKICLVENKNGDTMKYKLVDFDDSYMMCWRQANYKNDKGQKVYRKWTLKIDRYNGELTDDFELWNEIGEINPLDDEKPLKYDLNINGKYKCEKTNKLF